MNNFGLICWFYLLSHVKGDIQITVGLISYSNPSGQTKDGKCCDFKYATDCDCKFWCWPKGYKCDFRFQICLEETARYRPPLGY